VKSTVSATGNTYSLSSTLLPVNGSVHVEVYADISNRSSGTYQSKLLVQGTTAQSTQSVSTNSGSTFSGQTMTIGSGTIASALDAGSPVIKNLTANSTTDVAKFNFVATNDSFNITELQLKTVASSSEQGIVNVILKKADGTVVGSLPLSLSGNSQFATFGSLQGLTVPANDPNGLTLTAAVQTGNVGVNAATSGLNVGLTLNYFKNTNSSGTLATDNNDRAGNAQYLYNALPVVTPVTLPSTLLTNGTQTFSKFTVASTGASNAQTSWYQLLLNVAKSSGPNIASSGMQLLEDGVDITSQVTITTLHIGTSQTSGTIQVTANSPTERLVPVSGHTYELKANITNTSANDSIAASFNRPSSHISPTTASAATNSNAASFVWSDRSDNSHSTTSIDWENDYLINNLPFTQALSR
jgi:hypothetical protein